MYFAAALLVLVGCNNKDNALNNTPEGTPFKKGQQVTLTIGAGNNANQVTPRKVTGIDNTTDGLIEFRWEEDDQILVRVDQETAVFTLISEPGLEYGLFSGTMPADGSTFDIQYPINEPNITKQVYTTEKPIPADSMLFAATNCTLDNEATLLAQNAMLQLNLYGTDKTVGMIIFKNITVEPAVSDTLICTGGKTIDATSTEATPFYMIVPAGEYKFEVEVYDNAATPAKICSFATSAAKTFAAGECMNMPAKEVAEPYVDLGLSVRWATMNVGATKPEEYGDHFAWGETEPYYITQSPLTWKTNKIGYNWQSYCGADEFTEWITVPYDVNGVLKPEFDVATVKWGGTWRMPTGAEIEELMEKCTFAWTYDYNGTGVPGKIVTGPNGESFFLPADGDYTYIDNGTTLLPYDILANGCSYWCSTLDYVDPSVPYSAHNFIVEESDYEVFIYPGASRCYGYLVRPVCPKE